MTDMKEFAVLSRRSFIAATGSTIAAAAVGPAFAQDARVLTQGSGEPALLFVHGVGCAGEDWKAQLTAFSPKHKSMAIDLPGHGGSPMPKDKTIIGLSEPVIRAKKDSGASKVVLVGHSMGARVVREVYRTSPENVAGIIFVDSALTVGDMNTNIKNMTAQFEKGYDPFMKGLFVQMFVDERDPELRERIIQRAAKLDRSLGQALLIDIIRWDLTYGLTDLPKIKVPALVIQSSYYNSEFKRVPIQEGFKTPFMELTQKSIPNVDIKVVTGVGHFPMIQAADQTNRHIGDFLNRIA